MRLALIFAALIMMVLMVLAVIDENVINLIVAGVGLILVFILLVEHNLEKQIMEVNRWYLEERKSKKKTTTKTK